MAETSREQVVRMMGEPVNSREEDRARVLALADEEGTPAESAESLTWAANADPMDVLRRGNDVLEARFHATGEFVLLAELDLLAKEDPRALVAAAYAAVILSRLGEDAARTRGKRKRFRR